VLGLVAAGDREAQQICDDVITLPEVDEAFAPIVAAVPLQLFAYWVARRLGCDIDQPRNLAKSVTVE
jgi:glucosamine--fructose-6-phosphate aminotransferase (isomerizing)